MHAHRTTVFGSRLARAALAMAALALCGAALAADPKPSKHPPDSSPGTPKPAAGPAADTQPRCQPQAVTECRAACDQIKGDGKDKAGLARKQNDCKADCVRGC